MQYGHRHPRFVFLAIALVALLCSAVLVEAADPVPAADENWPAGSVDIADVPSRIASDSGPYGGVTTFQYQGHTRALNDVLAQFAKLRCPHRLLVIHPGRGERPYPTAQQHVSGTDWMNWSFTVWNPKRYYELFDSAPSYLNFDQAEFRAPLPPPRIDVWPDSPGLDWPSVHLPAGVAVTDMRAVSHGYKTEDGAVVAGVAYDMLTSKPIPAVVVTVARVPKQISPISQLRPDYNWSESARASGDNDGHFQATKIPPGYSAVMLSAPGYAPRVISTATIESGSFQSFAVRLSPAATLSGTVVDPAGKPLAGARIRLWVTLALDGSGYPTLRETEQREVTTDSAGRFAIADLPQGSAQISITLKHYWQSDGFVTTPVPAGPPDTPLAIVMQPTGAIHVTAHTTAGKPATGYVTCTRPLGTGNWNAFRPLDAHGAATLDDLPPATYTASLQADAKPGQPGVKVVEVKPGQEINVELVVP